jgi:TPR repeat protein
VKWHRLAAEQGHVSALTNLGVSYGTGQGVISNLAGAQGHENGSENRDATAKQMTPSNISKAQEMARVCLEKNYKGCRF